MPRIPPVHPLCICPQNGNQRSVFPLALPLLVAMNFLAATGEQPPQNADSTTLLQRGNDLRRTGRDEEALKLFKQADAQHPSPRGRAQIALAEQALGRWVASERDLSLALASPDDPWIEKNRATLEEALTAVRGHLARIVVLGSPAGAEVSINGERVGRLPLPSPISVVAGRVLVIVEAEGHVPVSREVDARVGELVRETVDLPPTRTFASPPSRVEVGDLNVTTSAPAVISVDDVQVGSSPVHTGDIRPGVHIVRAVFDGGGESSRKVRVQAGQSASLVLEQPASVRAAIDRKGLHRAVAVGAEAVLLGVQKSKQDAGGAVSPELDLNYGISPALDLRFGARAVVGQTAHGFLGVLGVPGSARLNLGGTFSLGLGGFVGLRTSPAPDENRVHFSREIGLLVGPEAFPAIFRLGTKHEIELSFEFGWLFNVTTSATTAYDVMHFGLNMTYLLFPSEPPKTPPLTSEPP